MPSLRQHQPLLGLPADVREKLRALLPIETAGLRASLGLIWAFNAYLAYQPEFPSQFVGYLRNAALGQPPWLGPWFETWIALVSPRVGIFVFLTRAVEMVIAVGLLLGLFRRPIYLLGLGFSLLVWSTADGFGGPYVIGTANLGPALVYALLFVALISLERQQGPNPYSLDFYLEKAFPRLRRFTESGLPEAAENPPRRLSWRAQVGSMVALALGALFFALTLPSALKGSAPTPENAAAAVSPITLMADGPVETARDARLPPLIEGEEVFVRLETRHERVLIANGVSYQAWTFNGTVPGPILHVRQGQRVRVELHNSTAMPHSVDFHAARIAPDVAYRDIGPGETLEFTFEAEVPGVFVYHCGTPPVLLHIANGMYGVIVVDPVEPLPRADREFVLEQSEWYTMHVEDRLLAGSFEKMVSGAADLVAFNGVAFQYEDRPLEARVGERIRFYLANIGPNFHSSFHVVGGIFDTVYPDGDPRNRLRGVSTYSVPPGGGAVLDLVVDEEGRYPFVDHSFRNATLGAVGVLDVSE